MVRPVNTNNIQDSMCCRWTGECQSHVPQQSSTDVRPSVWSSNRSETDNPTDTTRTGSGYTCRQTGGQTVSTPADRQDDRQSVHLQTDCLTSSTFLRPLMHPAVCRGSSWLWTLWLAEMMSLTHLSTCCSWETSREPWGRPINSHFWWLVSVTWRLDGG